jgi:hypothetical protein
MAKMWWQKAGDSEEKTEIPEDLKKQLEAGVKASEELPKLTALLQGLADTQAADVAARKKEKDDAAAASSRAASEAKNGTLEEQIEALMLEGRTKDAIALATQPTNNALLTIRADQIKREVFEDKAEEFKYYHGDIKKEVDALLNAQPLTFRNDPSNVANCYHTIVGKHTPEIMEGKIKTRFAAGEGSRGTSSGAAGGTGTDAHEPIKLTDDIRKAAKLLGFKPEEYVKILDDEGVGYV